MPRKDHYRRIPNHEIVTVHRKSGSKEHTGLRIFLKLSLTAMIKKSKVCPGHSKNSRSINWIYF
jgi:hypothetical protein